MITQKWFTNILPPVLPLSPRAMRYETLAQSTAGFQTEKILFLCIALYANLFWNAGKGFLGSVTRYLTCDSWLFLCICSSIVCVLCISSVTLNSTSFVLQEWHIFSQRRVSLQGKLPKSTLYFFIFLLSARFACLWTQ